MPFLLPIAKHILLATPHTNQNVL